MAWMSDSVGADGATTPRVSVCIPTFNNAAMVGDAIRSARAQTYSSLEILVLDNHSTDATPEAIHLAVAGDPRVRVVRHNRNLGMSGNFNAALSMAIGELLLVLCADDLLDPDCITVLAGELDRSPGCVLAACGRTLVDADLRPVGIARARRWRSLVAGTTLLVECFARGNVIGEPSSVLFRRSAASDGFDDHYCQLVDLDMWFKLLRQGDAILLPDAHCRIRRHPEQWSAANMASGRLVSDKRSFFRAYGPGLRHRLGPIGAMRWDLRMASSLARSGATSATRATAGDVFFPRLFRLLRPLVAVAYGLRSAWA